MKKTKQSRDEVKWEGAYARSEEQLARLADEALSEFRQGKTEPLERTLSKQS